MTLPVVFRDPASDDVHGVHSWYEAREAGLGSHFVSSLDLVVALIAGHPLSCPVVYRGIRRVLLPGFPYSLFYLSLSDRIVVLACLHQSRESRAIRKRLRVGA